MLNTEIKHGHVIDILRGLPADSVDCIVTSPPYYLAREYKTEPQNWEGTGTCSGEHDKNGCSICGLWLGELGQEPTPEMYLIHLQSVMRELRRVLKPTGTAWVNLGDTYDKDKNLRGVPWLFALGCRLNGWILRSEIIWSKTNPMPESVTDRPSKSHEHVFLLTKTTDYYYDAQAVREPLKESTILRSKYQWVKDGAKSAGYQDMNGLNRPGKYPLPKAGGRNRRTVWEIATQHYSGSHFAVFPEKLAEPCILAGSSEHGVCIKCGVPWHRVLRKTRNVQQEDRMKYRRAKPKGDTERATAPGYDEIEHYETVGWEAGCKCGIDTYIPAVVLDPFAGSGTAGAVALKNRRSFIGIELNEESVKLAAERIGKVDVPLI